MLFLEAMYLFLIFKIDIQIESKKLEWKTSSKVGSLDNAQHRPGKSWRAWSAFLQFYFQSLPSIFCVFLLWNITPFSLLFPMISNYLHIFLHLCIRSGTLWLPSLFSFFHAFFPTYFSSIVRYNQLWLHNFPCSIAIPISLFFEAFLNLMYTLTPRNLLILGPSKTPQIAKSADF